jgi:cell wall-associated NlpC family hydrolase
MTTDRTLLARHHFLTTALAYLGTPYVWGGDDPSGFDCSGFVLECLKSGGIVSEREDHTAEQLRAKFSANVIPTPRSGALQFLLDKNGKATHVVICLDEHFQIGASGGTSTTTSISDAWRQNAYIKIRPIQSEVNSVFIDPFQQKTTRI